MGRYSGPKGRVNRRLGTAIYESSGARRALEKRDYPPGMHTRRGKPTTYGTALAEKQKIKHYYCLTERQLRRYYDVASRREGNTGDNLLLLCERRLSNVIRRAGLATTRPQAHQGVVHCHFCVNGIKTNKPSFLVRPGDVITVRNRTNLRSVYQQIAEMATSEPVNWLNTEKDELRITVAGYPGHADISLPVEIGLVVEFMSR